MGRASYQLHATPAITANLLRLKQEVGSEMFYIGRMDLRLISPNLVMERRVLKC